MQYDQLKGVDASAPSRNIPLYVDPNVKAIYAINVEHAMVHEGKSFVSSGDDTLADAGVLNFLIKVPVGVVPHIGMWHVDSTGLPVKVDFFEGTTVSANGTAQDSFNKNRTSLRTASLLIYKGPTITAEGTKIMHDQISSGSKQSGGDSNQAQSEFILNASTNYLIRVTNNSGQSQTISHAIAWHEL